MQPILTKDILKMSTKIEDTKAFQQMSVIQQKITLMPDSRKKITDSVILLKNIGLERWEKLNNLSINRWKNIVKELAAF